MNRSILDLDQVLKSPAVIALFLVLCSKPAGVIAADPLNADPAVKYIGSQACVECHKEQHRSYLDTKHSRSMEQVDANQKVAEASFRHALSGNDYEVLHRGEDLIHREVIRGVDGEELATTERRIVYTMGSGTHGKSYIYQDGVFFGQSPISWYEESNRWFMSPGYDSPFHPGFGRKLSSECFFCHVGSIDERKGSPNDFVILEQTIGCERCHGPGELHATKYRESSAAVGVDDTIVNPARLSRKLSEAICQQCHLQAVGKALRAGKDEWDYRPGLPLTDFRVDYQYRLGDDNMRIVGHVEQLHMSECYKQSESLTCVTCHDPHNTPPPEAASAHYRSICLKCHRDDSCGESRERRMSVAMDDCARCHMPKKDTEVPHTAFHHHRIGVHDETEAGSEPIVGLTSVLDDSGLPAVARKRCEALAKFQVAQENPSTPAFRNYGIESAKSLIQIKNEGKADADVNTILALLAFSQGQPSIAGDLAIEVIATEKNPTRPRIESLRLLAMLAYQRRDFATAAKYYRELTQYQSEPHDFFQLGVSEQNSGNSERALAALRKAVELAPSYVEAHRALSTILQSQGRRNQAEHHARLVDQHTRRLLRLRQTMPR